MKRKGHNHKESFSILLISNTGQSSRQFHVSRFVSRLLIFVLLLICVALGVMGWMIYQNPFGDGSQSDLRKQLDEQEQLVAQLETEKESLNNELLALKQENEALRQASEAEGEEDTEPESEAAEDTDSDDNIPVRYPTSGTSGRLSSFSDEEPYLSISTHTEGSIVATGGGTIVSVTSDDTYPVIVEIEHDKGYRSRYMCRQQADVQAKG